MKQAQIWSDLNTGQLYAVIISNGHVTAAERIENHEQARCLNGVIHSRPELVILLDAHWGGYSLIDERIYRGTL